LNGFSAITPESILDIFKGKEPMRIRVEIIKAPIAKGLTLNTKFKFFGKVNTAKKINKIDLNNF
jgi:hypothetical protein